MNHYLGQFVEVTECSGMDSGKKGYIIKLNAPYSDEPGDYDSPIPCHLVRFPDGERRIPIARLKRAGDLPVNTWEVKLMARKQGAIGVFSEHVLRVRAEQRLVHEWAIQDAQDQGLEVSHVISEERLS